MPNNVRAKEVTVIAVESTTGEGTEDSPVRWVLSLFTKSGRPIFTFDPVEWKHDADQFIHFEDLFK